MNDLYRYDPDARLWTNLTWAAAGGASAPPPLEMFSFAAVDGRLYVFGGFRSIGKGKRPDLAPKHAFLHDKQYESEDCLHRDIRGRGGAAQQAPSRRG
jgi:hypothetical protein